MKRQFQVGDRVRWSPPWSSIFAGDVGTIVRLSISVNPQATVRWDSDNSSCTHSIDCIEAVLAKARIVGNTLILEEEE